MDGETQEDRESEDTVTADVIKFLIFLVKIIAHTHPPHGEPHYTVTKYTHNSGIYSALLCKINKGQNKKKSARKKFRCLIKHKGV